MKEPAAASKKQAVLAMDVKVSGQLWDVLAPLHQGGVILDVVLRETLLRQALQGSLSPVLLQIHSYRETMVAQDGVHPFSNSADTLSTCSEDSK